MADIDPITTKADKLMSALLDEASSNSKQEDVDFQLSVMQTVTRYMQVKARITISDEGNAFDDWRSGAAARTLPGAIAGAGRDQTAGTGAVHGSGGGSSVLRKAQPRRHDRGKSLSASAAQAPSAGNGADGDDPEPDLFTGGPLVAFDPRQGS